MDTRKNNKLAFSINKSEPLTNHFDRPFGQSHSYDEINTISIQFSRCNELVAQEIKQLLVLTEKFIVETESETQALRANNPDLKTTIEKSIKVYKDLFEHLSKRVEGITDLNAKSILQTALQYSRTAIEKRLAQLNYKKDPIFEYAKPIFTEFFNLAENNRQRLK